MSRTVQALRVVCARLGFYRPIYAHYGVTHRCNMRCRMCDVWKTGDAETELQLPQIERLAANLKKAGVRSVALGGGEPFVRKDLEGIVRAFAEQGFEVRLLTNGIALAPDRIARVISAGVRHVSVSLDSLDAQKVAFIYGAQDVWSEIVETMRCIRPLLQADSVPILNACVSKLNYAELPELVRFAKSLGFFASFVPVSLAPLPEQGDGFAAHAPEMAIQPADYPGLESAYAQLLAMKRQGEPIANSSRFLRDSLAYLKNQPCRWTCDAGRLYLSVSPQGDIALCHRFQPFARWDSDELAALLSTSAEQRSRSAEQRRNCPGCMRPCWAEISHAVHDTGALLEAAGLVFRTGRNRRAE